MKTVFSSILLITLLYGLSIAQSAPDTLWTRTYGGISSDWAQSICQTSDAGYIMAGSSNSFGAGQGDFYLVKTDSFGDTLWTRTFGGVSQDVAQSIQQTSDGGYIVAGHTRSFSPGGWDFYVVKTNSLGDSLWTRTYSGSSFAVAFSVQQTLDSGYIIAGVTRYSLSAGNWHMYIVKTNSVGDTLWTRTFGGTGHDEAYSVQQTSDEGYIIAGFTNSFGAGDSDIYLVKTNSVGDTLWTRTFGGVAGEYANSVQQTFDGGYIVAGGTNSFGAGIYDFYLVKTNSFGDTVLTRTFGETDGEYSWSVQQTFDGGYIVAGGTSAGFGDFYLVKTNSLGDSLWTYTFGGVGDEQANSVQQTFDGGYIVAGSTASFGAGLSDFYVVKLGPDYPSTGHVDLVSWGPPDWGYRLHHVSGVL